MTSEKKTRVAVLFGGVSSEHEISLMSVESVLANLPDHYEVLRIGITKDGRWVEYTGRNDEITSQKWEQDPTLRTAIVSPDRSHRGVLLLSKEGWELVPVDICFPVLHGKHGEDGTIQGLFQLAGIPFVGCDTISSANCMDKEITHTILEAHGIKMAKWLVVNHEKMQQFEQFAQQAEEKLGLDEPIFPQYVRWAQNALHGDFGISYKYKMPAAEVIASRAGNTLLLGGIGFVLIFTLSLLLGMLCAQREGTLFDRAVCKLGTITSCIPEFWLSLLLILIFAIELRVLPSSGAYSIGQQNNIADRAAHLILPLAVVVLGHLWYYAYMIRNRLLDEMRADYVLLAKAKGLTRRAVMVRHCLRNTMPTYLSIMAISVPHVLGGTYIVETVFSYPGLGTLAYESARYKDYNLLMLLSLLSGALVILCSIIAQTINEQIDPRIRAEQAVRETEVQP